MNLINEQSLKQFRQILNDKFLAIQGELQRNKCGDRANVSSHWNKYLRMMGVHFVHDHSRTKGRPKNGVKYTSDMVLQELIQIVNWNNERVSGSVMIKNPDRLDQFLLIPRDLVEKTLVLGLP